MSTWPIKRLREIADIQMGQSPKGDSYNTEGIGVPLINGPVEFGPASFSRTKRTKFTTEPTKMCHAGDLILCVRGSTTGRMNIAGFDSCIGRGVAAIRSSEHQDWINFFINANRQKIYRLGSGATFPNVSGKTLADLKVPLPPRSEQRRVVAILDDAFAAIDAAVANAKKNLANARELFESHLNALFTTPGEAWVEAPVSEAVGTVHTGPFGSLLHKRDYVIGGTPLINPANIASGKIIPDEKKTVDQNALDRLESYILRTGDIVIGRRGEMGRCAVVTGMEAGWLCGTGSFFIRTLPTADPDFVGHLLRSAAYRSQLERIATGATMKNLSNKALSKLTVSMPPIEKQRTIVSLLNQLGREVGRMEDVSSRRLGCLAGLRQSILQKAFSGELTAKEAEKEMAAA